MINKEIVKILDIEQNVEKKKKDGSGSYKVTVVTYKNSSGSKEEKQIMQSSVDKSDAMKISLGSLDMGDVATLALEQKEGTKFSNIVGIFVGEVSEVSSQLVPYAGGYNSNYSKGGKPPFDSSGMQIGNALNNACLLLAHKVCKGTPESVAEDILRLSEKLKARLLAGEYAVTTAPKAVNTRSTETFNEPSVEDDDIPWDSGK